MSQSQNRGCNRITGPRSDRHCERIGTGLVWKYVAVCVRVQHPAVLFGKVAHKLAINVFRVESYRCFHSAASRLAAAAATGGCSDNFHPKYTARVNHEHPEPMFLRIAISLNFVVPCCCDCSMRKFLSGKWTGRGLNANYLRRVSISAVKNASECRGSNPVKRRWRGARISYN